jgi:hypothetical protein
MLLCIAKLNALQYKVIMKSIKSTLAATEVLLVLPAALFLSSLFVRNLQPQQYEPARTAQRIVDWYSARPHVGLWVLLIALPFAVLVIGALTLLNAWKAEADLRQSTRQLVGAMRAHFAILLVAIATLTAGGILAIVALHVLTD